MIERSKYENFVTINHLPRRATVRIFNLGGQMVRKLEKEDDSQFIRWDLQNDHRFLVGSGLYIIYIEMPELGKTKLLKLAIIQKEIVHDLIWEWR